MNRLRGWLFLLCVLSLLLAPMYAQQTTGSITGAVTDPSGAVVPNAQVTVTSASTGLTRTVTTDQSGIYSVPNLPDGVYQVAVKAGNFKEFVARGVELHVSQSATVNAQLQLGNASEQVTVEASDIQVQTNSAALSEVVEGEQVRELPLNGRSFVQLTQLEPGVSPANNFDSKNKGLLSGVDFSVNGNATTNNLFLVDGANDNDVGSNRTILIYPSIEAISEFTMLRNSYGPEYGQASGAVINIVTRGGTNQFHGSALYFGRNDLLNAHEYFAARTAAAENAAGTPLPNNGKDVLRRNDWGYSLGGPIKKDKLFFFWSQEWNRELRGTTRNACVPTAAERAGDFSADAAYTSKSPGPCGQIAPVIPAALQAAGNPYKIANPDPAGGLLAQVYPLPNLPTLVSGNNWSQSLKSPIRWRQENARVDFNLTKANALMFRYTQDTWSNASPNLGSAGGLWGDNLFPVLDSNWQQPSKMIVAKLTSTIGTSMVNDAEFAYSNNRINITVGGSDPALLGQIDAAIPTVFPSSLKTSSLGLPVMWGGISPYTTPSGNLWLQAPWNNSLDIYTARDDLSKVHGSHTFKFGAFFGFNAKSEDDANPGQGERPVFCSGCLAPGSQGGVNTSNGLANVLLPGNVFSMSETSKNIDVHLRWRDREFYFGDTWKVSRKLTFNYGVRYSQLLNPYQAQNQFTSFQPQLYNPAAPASDACNGLWIVPGQNPCGQANQQFGTNYSLGTPGPNNSLVNQNYHLFAPRLGISWDPWGDGNTAIRAGLGQFYQRNRTTPYYVNAENAPFALTDSGVNRPLDVNIPPTTPPTTSPSGGVDPRNRIPNSWQWNLSVQHGFARDTTLEIGYVGNRAIHQLTDYDINAVAQSLWGFSAFTNNQKCPAASGTFTGFPGCPAGTPLRPFGNYGTLTYWTNNGDAYYHALQALFRTRYKRSELQMSYTWSHSIADYELDNSSGGIDHGATTFYQNPGYDRGNSTINRPQIFVANAIFYLPTLTNTERLVRGAFGGWELGVISQIANGTSRTIFQNGISEISTNLVNPTAPNASLLNSLTGSGYNANNRPNIVPGVTCGIRNSNIVYNPAAFTLIGYQIGSVGNEPRGYCFGPGLLNTDFSIDKNWQVPFVQNEKMRIQFRLDLFNAFNHANFRGDNGSVSGDNGPSTGVNCGPANAAGKYNPCGPGNNIVTNQVISPTFGAATLTKGGREIQYGLKLIF